VDRPRGRVVGVACVRLLHGGVDRNR